MSDLVPREHIEGIVGSPRQAHRHMARAISAERTVYILHSFECLDTVPDLRDCPYSLALDKGITVRRWPQDVCVEAAIERGRLVPAQIAAPSSGSSSVSSLGAPFGPLGLGDQK